MIAVYPVYCKHIKIACFKGNHVRKNRRYCDSLWVTYSCNKGSWDRPYFSNPLLGFFVCLICFVLFVVVVIFVLFVCLFVCFLFCFVFVFLFVCLFFFKSTSTWRENFTHLTAQQWYTNLKKKKKRSHWSRTYFKKRHPNKRKQIPRLKLSFFSPLISNGASLKHNIVAQKRFFVYGEQKTSPKHRLILRE